MLAASAGVEDAPAEAPRPRSVLVVGNCYPPHVMGGYELICRDHVRWLRARGVRVTVLTSTYGVDRRCEDVGEAGERIVRGLDMHWRDFRHERPTGLRLVAGELRQRRLLERLLEEERPEAAEIWQMATLSKSLLGVLERAGVPMSAVIEESWPAWDVEADHWLGAFRGRPERWAARRLRAAAARVADRAVSPVDTRAALHALRPAYCSASLREEVEAAVPELRGRGTVIHNGVEPAANPLRHPLSAPLAAPPRLLVSGRVETRKGVHTAVAALAEPALRELGATLTVAGWADEDYDRRLRRQAAELGVAERIAWLGPVGRAEVGRLLGEHDVFLFPTIWPEPFGLAALEALAAGCVVVATGSGGSGEFLVDGRTALRVPPEDPAAIAAAVARLASDPGLVESLRRGGRAMAEELTVDRFNAAVAALLGTEAVAEPEVDVVVVSWNVRGELEHCLEDVLASTGVRVRAIVVDNASEDGSADMVARRFPQVTLLRNAENTGFARAVNRGLAEGRAPLVLLLNPDTRLPAGALRRLVDRMDGLPSHGIVAPRLVDEEGRPQHSAYPPPSIGVSALLVSGAHRLLPRRLRGRLLLEGSWDSDVERDVPWAIGAALLVRRAAVEEVGPLHEGFFVYAEDVEWCDRMWRHRWRVRFLPDVEITHLGNRSGAKRYGRDRTAAWLGNTRRFTRMRHGRAWNAVYWGLNGAGVVSRYGIGRLTSRLRPTPARLQMQRMWAAHARWYLGRSRSPDPEPVAGSISPPGSPPSPAGR